MKKKLAFAVLTLLAVVYSTSAPVAAETTSTCYIWLDIGADPSGDYCYCLWQECIASCPAGPQLTRFSCTQGCSVDKYMCLRSNPTPSV